MPRDFFPRREADVLNFSRNFKERIALDPLQYGLSPEQSDQYGAQQEAFAALFALANANTTRTPSIIIAKSTALAELEAETRKLSRIVRACPSVTSQMRLDLGLSVSDGGKGTPTQAPDAPPRLRVLSVLGRTVEVRLLDADTTRRGKPAHVLGAALFVADGDQPPANLTDWTFKGNTTRTTAKLNFDPSLPPGTKVWLTAYWFSPRAANGPACQPVYTHLQYGLNLHEEAIRRAA
jgi:hypothetical protein